MMSIDGAAALLRAITRLADAVQRSQRSPMVTSTRRPVRRVWGVVVAVNSSGSHAGTVNVQLQGSSVTSDFIACSATYFAIATVGDTVYGYLDGSDLIIENRVAT